MRGTCVKRSPAPPQPEPGREPAELLGASPRGEKGAGLSGAGLRAEPGCGD